MIESPARVIRTEDGLTWVTSEAPESCGACGGRGCGSSLYARLLHPREPEFPVDNPVGARPGDQVVIGIPDGALLHASLASYVLPLLMVLAGAAAGEYWSGELISVVGALSGLALTALWLRTHRTAGSGPVILRTGPSGCRAH